MPFTGYMAITAFTAMITVLFNFFYRRYIRHHITTGIEINKAAVENNNGLNLRESPFSLPV
jgi:hypothetical protein